ncbi:DNA damage-inducible protein 1 [Gryganskiella cystojenkinii]|nr:DNA damage-inducible protein 1 [Gryganskiella cystojenkinii]
MELENIKALIEADCNVPIQDQRLFHNETELQNPKLTLAAYNVAQDDILTLRRRGPARQQQPGQVRSAVPGARLSGPAVHPGQIAEGGNAEQIRLHVLSDPQLLQQLREQALNANPFDMEAQARIEEAIRLENVAANLEAAMEYNPESFGRVTMLYIDVEVNGHPVKAFVDSGAQATIMSPECAEACGIMRLVDKRFAGIARGVGVAKILGRVHSAQIRVGKDLFLACSFTIMEGKGVDLLFGLDMLKRHQAVIDLAKNALVINETEIRFLSEHELPSSAKDSGELTQEELASIGGTVPNAGAGSGSGSGSGAPAQPAASASSTLTAPTTSSSTPAAPVQPAQGQATTHPESSISTLMGLGFNRAEVIAALDAAGGNVDAAASFLF